MLTLNPLWGCVVGWVCAAELQAEAERMSAEWEEADAAERRKLEALEERLKERLEAANVSLQSPSSPPPVPLQTPSRERSETLT
eukprot:586452-Prorocentrum_minimum.AAC.1